jgi:hypothetical protein
MKWASELGCEARKILSHADTNRWIAWTGFTGFFMIHRRRLLIDLPENPEKYCESCPGLPGSA